MNSSAKFTLSFLGAVALGGIAFACTTTSGTVDDTDGGINDNTSSSSSSGTTSSSSSSSGSADLCSQFDAGITIDTTECNTCLLTNCCQQTSSCFDIPDGDEDAGDTLGCGQYLDNLTSCDDSPGSQTPEECKATVKLAANPAVPAAYNAYLSCRLSSCATDCTRADPDAGTNTH